MDSIKDMVTLRAFALDKAVQTLSYCAVNSHFKEMVLERAKDIEQYIKGSADIHEYVDPEAHNKLFSDMFAKMQDNLKTKPLELWFPENGDIKPPYNTSVLVKIGESQDCFIGEYTKETGWEVPNAPLVRTIVAWMPIPPYIPML